MAERSSIISRAGNFLSLTFNFERNPERKTILAITAFFVILALATLGLERMGSGAGCTLILPQQKAGCLNALAGSIGSYSYCREISSQAPQYQCISSLAEMQVNISACSLLNSSKLYYTQCVEGIAYKTGNPSSCNLLDSYNQSLCTYALVQNSTASSISSCSQISNLTFKEQCESRYYYAKAVSSANESYCSMLNGSSNPGILYVLESQTSNLPGISALPYGYYDTSPRDYCYLSLSTIVGSRSCNYVSNSTLQSACEYHASTANTLNLSNSNITQICSSSQYNLGGLCTFSIYTSAAVTNNNASYCTEITNTSYRNYCLVTLATRYNQSSYCKTISDPSERTSCLYQISLITGNST